VGGYGIFYFILYQWDAGAGIQGLNFVALIALLFSGYVIHFRQELRYIRLQAAQRNQIADLEVSSNHDALTGLKNRRALRMDFPDYVGKTVWVIMADIDYFKKFNDTYGHSVGDELLVAISQEIRNVFGERTTYRYGGDEFLIMVECQDRAEVWPILVEWEKRIAAIQVETALGPVTPRCSFGLSGGHMRDESTVREQMRLADQKLYEVKNARA
jgi:diguanylate cyclase (GGDEF)-like protein